MSFERSPTATAEINDETLSISRGTVTLDTGWSPFVQGEIAVPLTSEELLEDINPARNVGQRVSVTATAGAEPRTFDCLIRGRSVSYDGRELTIYLESDERLLQGYSDIIDDATPRTHEGDLRALVNYVLARAVAGALEPGDANADLTAAWAARNLIPDPRMTGVAGMTTYTNVSALWEDTYPGPQAGIPHRGLHLYDPTSGDSYTSIGGDVGEMRMGMRAGSTYVFSASGSVRSVMGGPENGRERRLVVHAWSPSRGGWVISQSQQVPNVRQWSQNGNRVWVEFTVPEDATQVFLRAYHGRTSGSITWGLMRLTERGPGTVEDDAAYFWGGKPSDRLYRYTWDGEGNLTASSRTPIDTERSPELFTWTAGVTAWDFLEPLLSAAGLRLYCDEQRRWHLVDPRTFRRPGRISVRTDITTAGTDDIDLVTGEWADGVVIEYVWDDLYGRTRRAYDTAGAAGRVYRETIRRAYPGPGRAAAVLLKRQGRLRTQQVTVAVDFTAEPGQDVQIDLPGTATQLGTLTRVDFGLSEGLMTLSSAGLTETPRGAINLLPGIIDDLPGTIDSL